MGEQDGRFREGARKTTWSLGRGEEAPALGVGPERLGRSLEGQRGGGERCFRTPLPPAVITLPNKYKGLVCGLCGNFDGNKRNDFVLPNGTITQDLIRFGNSWEVHRISGGLARFAR